MGLVILFSIFYLQFGLKTKNLLGKHNHLDFNVLNSNVIGNNYNSNLYYLMGINRCSSAKDIQFRFRKLSKLLHPDRKAKPLELEQKKIHLKYEELSEIYEFLGDPVKRDIYDKFGLALGNQVRSSEELIRAQNVLLNSEVHFELQNTFLFVACAILSFKIFGCYVNISFAIGLVFLKVV